MKEQTIENYRLTGTEEPSDEILAQLMHEAAEDARIANDKATKRFFDQLRQAAAAIK